jgi:hypothetical protein
MSKVIGMGNVTKQDIPVERMRDNIDWGKIDTAIIIAVEGNPGIPRLQVYSSTADAERMVFLAQMLIQKTISEFLP